MTLGAKGSKKEGRLEGSEGGVKERRSKERKKGEERGRGGRKEVGS